MRFRKRFVLLVLLSSFVVALCFGKEKEKPGKNPSWPPKAGIKTPGIQIPFANLKADAELTLEGSPTSMLAESPTVLLPLKSKGIVARMGTRDNKLIEPWKGIDEPCGGILSAFGTVWVPDCKSQTIARFESRTGKVKAMAGVGVGKARQAIAANADSVWVLSDDKGTLSRVDPEDNSIVSELRLGPSCNTIQFEQEALWVTCPAENRLLRIDAKSNLVDKRIEVATEPISVAFGEGHLWVLGNKEGKVSKVDPKTFKVVATIETGVPMGDGSIAFGDGQVWVSSNGYPLTKIDAKSDKVVQQFAGDGGGLVRFASGSVWLLNPTKLTVSRFDPKRIAATLPD
jgi:streptogramin lyase